MKYAILASSFDTFVTLSDFAGAGNYDPFDDTPAAVAAVESHNCDTLLVDNAAAISDSPSRLAAVLAYINAYGGTVAAPAGPLGGCEP